MYLFVLRAFYAHGDARTPFVINIVRERHQHRRWPFVLVGRYGVLGLGAAFAVAYLLSAVWAMQVLAHKVPGFAVRPIVASCARMGLAALVLAR